MSSTVSFLEFLEPRIAPATLNIGDPAAGLGFDVAGYNNTSVFKFAYDAPFQGAPLFTSADPGATDHYFMALAPRDVVNLVPSTTARIDAYLKVDAGLAYAFFHDKNSDFKVTANELTGLAISGGANLSLKGSVDGDIVANVDARTKFINTGSLISTAQNVAGLNIAGDAKQIIAGGNISRVSVGSIDSLQSGNSNQPLNYALGASATTGNGTLAAFKPGNGASGGNLADISVRSADLIIAGLGGDGGKGGDIRNLTIVADPDGVDMRAGAGGNNFTGTGGAGGSIFQILYRGAAESDATKTINILAGDGGDGRTGGKGGDINQAWLGYDRARAGNSLAIESPNILLNKVDISGGQGGDGVTAGAGGNLTGIRVVAAPPAGVGPEIVLQGGDAGLLTTRGGAGAGGSVNDYAVKNYHQGASEVLVTGGDASLFSLGAEASRAAAGGSMTNPVPATADGWFVGREFEFRGGNGSLGGNGGAISNIYFERQVDASLRLTALEVLGGNGGDAAQSNGGVGGAVQGVFVPNSFLAGPNGLQIQGGNGGWSNSGSGGTGGSVTRIDILAAEPPVVALLTAKLYGGSGGDGRTAGGTGGNLSDVKLFTHYSSLEAKGGKGGDVVRGTAAAGSGGAGGSVSRLSFAQLATVISANQTVAVDGGNGGNARLTGAGGAGGSVSLVGIVNPGNITLNGGQGGDAGLNGGTGNGGSVGGSSPATFAVSLNSQRGSVDVAAGAGGDSLAPGQTPARGGTGGSLGNINALAATGVTLRAGDGGAGGGHGGSLNRVGFSGSGGPGTLVAGAVVVEAGDGAAPLSASQTGGNGGSISNVSGYGSAIAASAVTFQAGQGGSASTVGARGGGGGGISNIAVYDTAASGTVVAGHGGNGFAAGGTGGSVSNVAFKSLTGQRLHAVAAGDGGDVLSGRAAGAVGGSINKVDASNDIGLRQGAAFGFGAGKMGGIFAGAAGVNTALGQTEPNTANNGRVSNVTAAAISSIVAGRDATPWLVNTVDRVYLRGNAALSAIAGDYRLPDPLQPGTFLNGAAAFGAANLVGGKLSASSTSFAMDGDPARPPSGTGGSAWTYGVSKPTDGLIAALTFTSNRNFMPLAILTNIAAPRAPLQIGLLVPTLPVP